MHRVQEKGYKMSKIEWTEKTWNPLAGCTRASPGCDNCYAAGMSLRLEGMANAKIAKGEDPKQLSKYIGVATRNAKGVAAFNSVINLDYEALNEPLTWKKTRLVFVNSMSDLFHHNVPDGFICAVFDVMKQTPQHTYQVLTKRPDTMAAWQQEYMPEGLPANVWVGTSVENQAAADERIPHLLNVEASVRFLSMEPLLDKVDTSRWLVPIWFNSSFGAVKMRGSIHWVIVGGESGHNARPMHPDWARSLRDQCQEAGVPYFFKQWGKWAPCQTLVDGWTVLTQTAGNDIARRIGNNIKIVENGWDMSLMASVGKGKAGRLLDGREWNEMPNIARLISS